MTVSIFFARIYDKGAEVNLILLYESDFDPASPSVTLRGRRRDHVLQVHRSALGDRLRVGLLDGLMGIGTVTAIVAEKIVMTVLLDTPPPPPLPLTLCLALPRPKTLKKVLQSATALGVKKIYLMRTWRVEKSYWQSPLLQPELLAEQCVLGLEQACDTVMPKVEMRPLFKPFVEDELPAIAAGTRPLAAHPGASERCPVGVEGPVTLAIGPEGGFLEYEVDCLRNQGFTAVSLGPRIVRVEDSLPVLVGRMF
jgi:16S rRNA (uracil1498-N3)-methyltransferase